MNIIALDLSLTSTGIAFPDGRVSRIIPPNVAIPGTKKTRMIDGMERLHWIRESIIALVLTQHADLVAIENYSFDRVNQSHYIGELGGVVRLALYDARIPYVDVSPGTIKKFATGKGNASKDDVLLAAVRKLKYAGNSKDEADALWLWTIAKAHYEGLAGACTALQQAAIAGTQWPEIPAFDLELAPKVLHEGERE